MSGVGLKRILCQHVPRVTPGTRAKNYSLIGVTSGSGPAWDGKDYLLLFGQRADVAVVQGTVDRAAAAPPGGPQVAPNEKNAQDYLLFLVNVQTVVHL